MVSCTSSFLWINGELLVRDSWAFLVWNTWEYWISIGYWGNWGYLSWNSEESEENKAEMQGRINSFEGAFYGMLFSGHLTIFAITFFL